MPILATGSNAPRDLPVRRSAEHGFTPLRRSAEHGFMSLRRSAEHGFTSLRRSAEHGFTLVELMVVIAIMALATATVTLAMGQGDRRVRLEAEGLAARMLAARNAAVIGGHDVALWVDPAGSGFEKRRRGAWVPTIERPFGAAAWREGTTADLSAGVRQRIVFDTTGAAEPATVMLRHGETRIGVAIGPDGAIRVAQ